MRGGIELAAKSVQARSRSSREEVTVNVNEGGHGSHGRSSMVGIVLVVLLVFAGAYYIVTTYIAGFVTGVENWWHGVVNGWNNFWHHPFGLSVLPIASVLAVGNRDDGHNRKGARTLSIVGTLSILFGVFSLSLAWVAIVSHRNAYAIAGYMVFSVFFLLLSVHSIRKRNSLLFSLPITVILMAKHKEKDEDGSGRAAWLILGIIFVLFTLGALYATWIDYMVASLFNGGIHGTLWGALMFPLAFFFVFLALAVLSFRKSRA